MRLLPLLVVAAACCCAVLLLYTRVPGKSLDAVDHVRREKQRNQTRKCVRTNINPFDLYDNEVQHEEQKLTKNRNKKKTLLLPLRRFVVGIYRVPGCLLRVLEFIHTECS